jgi:hypothetical protein
MTTVDKPDWLKAHQEANTSSAGQPGWQPGQSGNPKGRPVGAKSRKTVIADEFAKEGSAVAQVVLAAAKGGCMTACNLVLARLTPPLRARAERVTFELNADAPLTQQAQQVLSAVAAGDIDPETGKLLIDAISAFAGLKATDDLENRLAALEGRQV